jgi:hypothetical protein
MISASARRKLARDPDDEVETRIYQRSSPMAWERVMVLQIMRDLGPFVRAAPPPRRPGRPQLPPPASASGIRVSPARSKAQPNVFLTPATPNDAQPPWAGPSHAIPSQEEETRSLETLVRDRNRKRRRPARRSMMPWVLFVMAFLIAFGIGEDRVLRRQLANDIRATVAQVITALHSVHR